MSVFTFTDGEGTYIRLPKCNFDVEITVDATKTIDTYDTFCLLSSDADFAYFNAYLRSKGKKVILVKGGHITHQLKQSADLRISAQTIKKHITMVMQKPGIEPGFAECKPEYLGQVLEVYANGSHSVNRYVDSMYSSILDLTNGFFGLE